MNISIKKDGKLIKKVSLEATPLIIGRSAKATLQLMDPTISRVHVRISNQQTSVLFEDLNSRNGIFFKGDKVDKKEIYPGQNMRVGAYVISINMIDPAEQKTIAMLEDADARTEVALSQDELAFGIDDKTADAPPNIADSNPLIQQPQDDIQDNTQDSFMQAIAVSSGAPTLEESAEQDKTSEQESMIELSNPAFAPIERAPEANLEQEQVAEGKPPMANPLIEPEPSQTARQTKKVNADYIETPAATEDSNPLFLEVAAGPADPREADPIEQDKTPAIAFSSLQSSPEIEVNDTSRDIFKSPKEQDQQQGIETGAITPPPMNHVGGSKTQIRNFDASPVPPKSTGISAYKKYMFFGAAILIALMMLFLDKDVQKAWFQSSPDQIKKKPTSEDEITRIVSFKIEHIQKSLEAEDLEAAKQEMKTLLTEYASHPALKKFRPSYTEAKTAIEEKFAAEAAQAEQRKKQIASFTQQAEKLTNDQELDAAIETYQKILAIDPANEIGKQGIETIETIKIQQERKQYAKQKKHQMLDRIYNEGVEKFEAGEFGKAKKLFQQVIAESSHRKHARAKTFLYKIATQTDGALNSRIAQARSQIDNPITLPDAYKSLSDIIKQFPQHKQAKEYFDLAQNKMQLKAKQIYAEAIAQEELAGDFSTALDLYHEVLIYAPDPASNYHQKAKVRIEKLEL